MNDEKNKYFGSGWEKRWPNGGISINGNITLSKIFPHMTAEDVNPEYREFLNFSDYKGEKSITMKIKVTERKDKGDPNDPNNKKPSHNIEVDTYKATSSTPPAPDQDTCPF
jgi:hypothetical protein